MACSWLTVNDGVGLGVFVRSGVFVGDGDGSAACVTSGVSGASAEVSEDLSCCDAPLGLPFADVSGLPPLPLAAPIPMKATITPAVTSTQVRRQNGFFSLVAPGAVWP